MGQFLSFKEKLLVLVLAVIGAGALLAWMAMLFLNFTRPVAKVGGEYVEGMTGQPLYVNPLLSQTNETDAALAELVYGGLLTYDAQGKVVPDLAERFDVSDDKLNYTFYLRPGLRWHDDEPLTADDVIFTVNAIQSPAYRSPLRQNWQGVEAAKIDDSTVKFTLKNPYFGFLGNLTTGILPRHAWENILPDNFSLANLNRQPIGSGPYRFEDFQNDSNGNILVYRLRSYAQYHRGAPYISRLTFNFYPDEETMRTAYNKREIMGMSSLAPDALSAITIQDATAIHNFRIPRYFAVFFNQTKSVPLAHDEVREALELATDRQAIVNAVRQGSGFPVAVPVLAESEAFFGRSESGSFDRDRAVRLLEENGWKTGNDGVREKDGTRLEFRLMTPDWIELAQTALVIKGQWEQVGARVNVESLSAVDLQQGYIRPREYEALLFGQSENFEPDPYPFWHSSQKKDPGLNLALFGSDEADTLLADIRQMTDANQRSESLRKFQEMVVKEHPAVFLYSPAYIFPANRRIRGIEFQNLNLPSDRFADIHRWYVKTKRVWK